MARIRTHVNPLNINQRVESSVKDVFPEGAEFDLEIGVGRGVFLRHFAKTFPERHIIGVDVRNPIIEILNERLEKEEIHNAHLIHSTGQIVLEDFVPDLSLDKVFVFHPDPWFKKKHHKRRIINQKLLDILIKKMKPAGRLYLSTDVTLLWEDMMEVCDAHDGFSPIEEPSFWTEVYKTHWHVFSQEDERPFHSGVYTKV